MNLNKYLIGLVASVATCSAFASPLLSEGFNDISTLGASGWVMTNNSGAVGSTNWFQGQDFAFPAAAGASNSYIAANFNNAVFGGAVSNWLITPEVAMTNGEQLNFSLRLLGEGAVDTVQVYYSTAGASSNVGSTATSTGDFRLLGTYSASADTGWTNNTLALSGLSGATTGRYAFRYLVDDTSVNGDYIGIDSVNISAVPEPTTALMLLLGLGVVAFSRKKQLRLLALAGLSASTLVAQAAEPQTGANGLMSFPNARVAVQPELAATAAPAGSGMVAYKDAATGQLVGPSAEQAAELAAAAVPAAASVQSTGRQAASARVAPLTTARGGVGRKLDDSTASYAVVHKDANGQLVESCVPGEDVASHLAHGPSLPAAQGEQQ
ncbi:PEP-CTERM sorting domain-containing protein [Duganella sp. BJB1802]|uniref:choice-of-anchor J family PEP-CTERM protein n=1 Tax=Duganella sp. BJB1802 TaxID=2744575 RepID=UPI001594BB3B|nr:choice-of-anchor J domain-containing protein [Duganella sp. BJB1802]NVD69609.1 PEP-CTERM sorting domain-containing protein [Duganella sp. BJB1802]